MKRLVLLILFIPTLVWGASFNGSFNGACGAPSGCTTPTTGDTLNEGFLGTGYENTWAEGAGTPNEDATLSGTPPVASCSEGMAVASTHHEWSRWDNGSTIARSSDIDIVCEIYFAGTIGANYSGIDVVMWDVDTTPYSSSRDSVYFRRDANDTSVFLYGRGGNQSAGIDYDVDGPGWRTVKLHLDGATPASSYIQCTTGCTDSAQKTFTRQDTADGRYLVIGTVGNYATNTGINEFGYCYVDTP